MFWLKENQEALTHVRWGAFTTSIDFSMGSPGAACVAMRPLSRGTAGKVPACLFIPCHPSHRLFWNYKSLFLDFLGRRQRVSAYLKYLVQYFPFSSAAPAEQLEFTPHPNDGWLCYLCKIPGHPCRFLQAVWNFFSQRSCVKFEIRKQDSSMKNVFEIPISQISLFPTNW